MAAKRRKLISPAHVRPPPTLPAIGKPGLRLSRQELATIRRGMAVHAASLRPKLTWRGWHQIALACAIGAEHLKKAAGGRTDTPTYIRAMHDFLKRTGFCFLNKDDRAAAVRLLPYWDEIDEWRYSLSDSRQHALNIRARSSASTARPCDGDFPFTSDSFRLLLTGYSTNKGDITVKSALLVLAFALVITLPAEAGYSCTSRKSGSYTISNCSGSHGGSSHCTSYRSGHVRKTYCR